MEFAGTWMMFECLQMVMMILVLGNIFVCTWRGYRLWVGWVVEMMLLGDLVGFEVGVLGLYCAVWI